ncbi:transcriptional regulator, LuxR family [Fibrisoma limi BUZ 3]|uniref:Transcriptional regulator, LuxR family n=2 Tax=Fibrisoma limi TaxID=663275 RepID=I2GFK6_9BACT|nr:transcriptional regulator, LuxR family [Fibrisoma limi BUZ 3]
MMNEEQICISDPAEVVSVSLVEKLFPGWVVAHCLHHHNYRFLSHNGAAFFGLPADELHSKLFLDLFALIHPDDVDAYRRVIQKVDELLLGTEPTEINQYRFVMHYRLRRGGTYLSLHEERLFFANGIGQFESFALFKDVSAERLVNRVQLDWYRVDELGYRKLNSYVPTSADQGLTGREIEIIRLIKEGLSSKEIAERLCISINTVRNHRSNLFRKTQARNVVDLVKSTAFPEMALC